MQTDVFMQRFREMAKEGVVPDSVFFLDKSARPLAYMFRKLFPAYVPDVKMPAIRYINIGEGGDRYNDPSSKPFTGDPGLIRQTYGKHLDEKGGMVVVDDYTDTGESLDTASKVLEVAFPDADVIPIVAYEKVPNWYQNPDYLGVDEYSFYDYQKMALDKFNRERGTSYKKTREIGSDDIGYYEELRQQLTGSIPYVKKGPHHMQTTYKESGDFSPDGEEILVEEKINVFRQTREELDEICKKVREQADLG